MHELDTMTGTPDLLIGPKITRRRLLATLGLALAGLAGCSGSKKHARPVRAPFSSEDTLLLPTFQTEADILALAPGGMARLSQLYEYYYSAGRNALQSVVAGPDLTTTALGEPRLAHASAVFPISGALPTDQFTIECYIYPIRADYTALPAGVSTFWDISSAAFGQRLLLYREGTRVLTVQLIVNHDSVAIANLPLAIGDAPPDIWVPATVTFDGALLSVILGSDGKRASGSIAPGTAIMPWGEAQSTAGGGGLTVNGSWPVTTPADQRPFKVTAPRIRRYAPTPHSMVLTGHRNTPTLLVDASAVPGESVAPLGGMFAQYAGWRVNQVNQRPSIRGAILWREASDGLRVVRIDHVFDKIGISGASAPYAYTWATLDEEMDALHAYGMQFHVTLGYTPAGYGPQYGPPRSASQFAHFCVSALQHWNARGYKVRPILSLWNEPDLSSFWNGTFAQYSALWAAVRSAIAQSGLTNWQQLPYELGGPDGSALTTEVNGFHKQLVDYCAAKALPLPAVFHHEYGGDLCLFRMSIASFKRYLRSKGFATTEISVTEWNAEQALLAQAGAVPASLANSFRPDIAHTQWHAAYCAAMLSEIRYSGCTLAIFTRMGVVDPVVAGGAARFEGAMTSDSPPRPLPVYAVFRAFWQLNSGGAIPCTSNWPWLRGQATKTEDGRIAVFYSAYRPADSEATNSVTIFLRGLPPHFRWVRYHSGQPAARVPKDLGLRLVKSGTEVDFADSFETSLLALGTVVVSPD